MTNDPIVQEVRRIRHEIEQECNHDPDRYYQHLKSLQKKYPGRMIRRGPKPLITGKKKKTG